MRIVSFSSLSVGFMDSLRVVLANAIIAALVREFGMDEGLAGQIAQVAGKLQFARWMAGNIKAGKAGPGDLQAMAEAIGAFERLKPKLKAQGQQIDVTKYDYPTLKAVVEKASVAPSTTSQIRSNLPPELISIVSRGLGVAQRFNPKTDVNKARPMAFQWVEKLFIRLLEQYKSWGKPNFKELAIKKTVEDKREIADAMGEYFAFAMSKPGVLPITDFDYHYNLSKYVDELATPEEMESKYRISEPDTGIEGTRMIALPNGYRALRVSKWSERFADELCKSARWCVRNQKMFEEEYHVSDAAPLYMLMKGDKQIGLLSLKLAQFKDARDADIGSSGLVPKEMMGEIYEAMVVLAETEGVELPMYGDFLAFIDQTFASGKFNPKMLLELKDKLQKMEDENSEAAGYGDTPPHGEADTSALESTISELKSTYAPQYLELAAKSLNDRDLKKIINEVLTYTNKRKGWRNQDQTNIPDVYGIIGKIGKDRGPGGGGDWDFTRLFRNYDPKGFMDWASAIGPTDYGGVGHYLGVINLLLNPNTGDFAPTGKILTNMYEKLFSSNASKKVVEEDKTPLGNDRYILGRVPVPEGHLMVRDNTGTFFIGGNSYVDQASYFAHRFYELKKIYIHIAEVKKINLSGITAKEAGELFKISHEDTDWDERRGEYTRRQKLTDEQAARQFEIDLGYMTQRPFYPRSESFSLGFAEFTLRIINFDGLLEPFFGKEFQQSVDSGIAQAKATGKRVDSPKPELVRAWLATYLRVQS